ncbi:MAG: hypothetical protein IJT58_05680 [Synergistaceae bacterium]|nr:hypothetical protein [Synergistaceae bacterium]
MIKRFIAVFLFLVLAVFTGPAVFADESDSPVLTQQEKGLIDWTNNYVEAQGMAVAPPGTRGAQAKAMARRGAMLDLQRNLLEFLSGVQVDSETRMENFMAEDRVKSEVHGVIRNVEAVNGEWDGEVYTIKGRIKLADVRKVIANKFPEASEAPEVVIYEDEDDEPEPEPAKKVVREKPRKPAPRKPAPRKSARYTGLVIDVRHLPYVPAMMFNVYDAKGRPVYGMSFVNRSNYLQSGLCAYFTNLHSAQDNYTVASSPITAKAVKLGKGNVDIYISNSDAAKVRASSPDFRKTCRVIVVSR